MENEKTTKKYVAPAFEIVRFTETDGIASLSGDWEGENEEGELIPIEEEDDGLLE